MPNHNMRSSVAMSGARGGGVLDDMESSVIEVDNEDVPQHVSEQFRETGGTSTTGGGENWQQDKDDEGSRVVVMLPSLYILAGIACMALLLGAAGTVLGIINLMDDDDSGNGNGGSLGNVNILTGGETKISSLETITERGYINCGVGAFDSPGFILAVNGGWAGMEYDLCLMLTAAIFNGEIEDPVTGEARFRIMPMGFADRWKNLLEEDVDVLFGATYNMERDVFEPSVQKGFTFSFPYFLDGVAMGGIPENVDCAEALDFNSSTVCEETLVCVWAGTTHETIMSRLIPPSNLVLTAIDGVNFPSQCQVTASETAYLSPAATKQRGYFGGYKLGTRFFSREPISMVTRQDDPRFSDLVEWLVQALVYAEEEGITKASSFRFSSTYVFGGNETNPHPTLEKVFENAIAVRGNYGEMYNFNMQNYLPRGGMNKLNRGNSPIIFSFPFGETSAIAPEIELTSPTVAAIKKRGFLNCGVNIRKGFAKFDTETRMWSGFDVELCRAIAAALFDGVDSVVYTDLPAAQRFQVLADKRVDLLARLTTWTLSRDVKEPATGMGLSFSSPYFHDGLKFGGLGEYAACADNLDVISPVCQDLKICLLEGTTIFTRVKELFRDVYIFPQLTFQEIIAGLNDGSCNAIAGGFHDVALDSVRERGYIGAAIYSVGENLFSKDPLALTTRQDDPVWSDFVKWIFWALVYAEENFVHQATASAMPRIKLFGPLRTNAFYHAVNLVGNYGELYNRNFADLVPRGGMHELNVEFEPMLRALPGINNS